MLPTTLRYVHVITALNSFKLTHFWSCEQLRPVWVFDFYFKNENRLSHFITLILFRGWVGILLSPVRPSAHWSLQYSISSLHAITTFLANSADDKLTTFFLVFPEKWIWHFMQIIFSLHNMLKPVFWKNKKKYFKMSLLNFLPRVLSFKPYLLYNPFYSAVQLDPILILDLPQSLGVGRSKEVTKAWGFSLNIYFMYNINIFEHIQDMCLLHYNIIQWDSEESQLTYEVRLPF